jgi:lantibiotic biosynthesis protein
VTISPRWEGGHCGFGMAHGIAGPLALLSAAMLSGITVTAQADAIHTICAWYDRWQTGRGRDTWWPELVDRHELQTSTVSQGGPLRPSWCYGTPGVARALQLAGHASGDLRRADLAEQALTGCLTDSRQTAYLTDASICHGWAGAVHTARRALSDTSSRDLAVAVRSVGDGMRRYLRDRGLPDDDGFLEGAAGVALAGGTGGQPAAAETGWDACLLVA